MSNNIDTRKREFGTIISVNQYHQAIKSDNNNHEIHKCKLINDLYQTSTGESLNNAKCRGVNMWETFKNLNTGRNNFTNRFCRFINEKGYYLSNDFKDKYCTIVNILLIIITITIIVSTWYYNATSAFVFKSHDSYHSKLEKINELCVAFNEKNLNKSDQENYRNSLNKLIDIQSDTDMELAYGLDTLNDISNGAIWQSIKLLLSVSVGTILIYNIYKRTTVNCNLEYVPLPSLFERMRTARDRNRKIVPAPINNEQDAQNVKVDQVELNTNIE